MNDVTYEYQRMISRKAEIQESAKKNGAEAAWDQYARDHGLDRQRFRNELTKLRSRFDGIASGRKHEG